MNKTIAKVVRHVTHKKHAPSHPEHAEEVESQELDLATDEPTDPMAEAFDILSRLAQSTPAHMGTAHGIQLIHDAQAWLAAHAETEMKLETQELDEFVEVARLPGTEVYFTVAMPDGSQKTFNMNAVFVSIHAALHSLHHFMDPDGAHHTGYPVMAKHVKPEDNPTNPGGATIGQGSSGHLTPEQILRPSSAALLETAEPMLKKFGAKREP